MFEHLVIFKFNDKITLAKQQEFLAQLLALKDQIPGIIDLTDRSDSGSECDGGNRSYSGIHSWIKGHI
ncbi:hypothetical protein PAECIP112173_01590 [Paenibacillus sp. JJ-100]|uniref:Dabb family protein n=1 Tax=Paenibacillus sp. JJ-100 TaxID=2974896 RepID=UPI0022FF929B|nr:Dabb family protein [Paenibacillus sp. JJ-100]CAI6056035.1 hypothetical protein PAECIP112173_01590 [Paenibacillus sp. JJ-100]